MYFSFGRVSVMNPLLYRLEFVFISSKENIMFVLMKIQIGFLKTREKQRFKQEV